MSPARAGSYQVPAQGSFYSGGQCTCTLANGMQFGPPQNYSAGGGGYGISGGDGGGGVSCGGAITVSLTWTPATGLTATTDPPPTDVIVMQSCTVSAGGTNDSPAGSGPMPVSGGCDTGLGVKQGSLTQNTTGDGSPPSPYVTTGSAQCALTQYTVKPGGSSFSLSCTPTAQATGNHGCSASVSYSAAVYPVTIGGPPVKGVAQPLLGGATNVSGALEALTGQTISASLYCGIGTLSNLQWSTTGGSPFETWNPNTIPQYVPLSSNDADATGQTFTYNDAIGGDSVTVKCTATLTLPDGTTQTVTATSASVTFQKPTASWGVDPATIPFIYQGQVQKAPPTIGFVDMSLTSSSFGVSTWWYPIKISVPAPFSGGVGGFVQIATPTGSITRTPTGAGVATYTLKMPNAQGQLVVPGTGRDGAFPYGYGFVTDANGNIMMTTDTHGNIIPMQASSSQFNAGGIGASGDSPPFPEDPADQDKGGTYWTSATWKDTFTTWLMYQPPGGVWVPLEKASSWSGSGNGSGGPNNWLATGSYTAPSPASVIGNASDFPQWTQILAGVTPEP